MATNVTFVSNRASYSSSSYNGVSYTYGYGGAIYMAGLTVASRISYCNFTANTAYVRNLSPPRVHLA